MSGLEVKNQGEIQKLQQICKLITKIKNNSKKSEKGQKFLVQTAQISEAFKSFANLAYSPDIESLRGLCFQLIHKYELALYIYQQILIRFPFHAPTLRRKGELLKKTDSQSQASKLLQLAGFLEPDNLHLQILRQNDENDGNSQSESEDDSINNDIKTEPQNKWIIRIKSIDKPVSNIKSSKSVLFKSELLEQNGEKHELKINPIKSQKSILKARSYQQVPTVDTKYNPQIQTKSTFDTKKIKSIDGKVSSTGLDSKKQILFSIDNNLLKHEPANANTNTSKLIRRKSSLVSKLSSSKSAV